MKSWIYAILLTPFLIAAPLQAGPIPTTTVWTVFKDMGGTEITATDGKYNLQVGQQFQAQVWFNSTADWVDAELAFRFGTATEEGGSDIDDHFRVNPVDTYVNPLVFEDSFDWGNGGLPAEPAGTCAYANFIELYNSKPHRGGTSYLGVVYTLRNNMALGDSGKISIYSNPDHEVYPAGTTVGTYYAPVVEYTLATIPEPSSLMAMGCAGVGVLGNLLHRRRKKTAANVS